MISSKWHSHFEESCGALQRTRFARTFALREVFLPTYTPPSKSRFRLFCVWQNEKIFDRKDWVKNPVFFIWP